MLEMRVSAGGAPSLFAMLGDHSSPLPFAVSFLHTTPGGGGGEGHGHV